MPISVLFPVPSSPFSHIILSHPPPSSLPSSFLSTLLLQPPSTTFNHLLPRAKMDSTAPSRNPHFPRRRGRGGRAGRRGRERSVSAENTAKKDPRSAETTGGNNAGFKILSRVPEAEPATADPSPVVKTESALAEEQSVPMAEVEPASVAKTENVSTGEQKPACVTETETTVVEIEPASVDTETVTEKTEPVSVTSGESVPVTEMVSFEFHQEDIVTAKSLEDEKPTGKPVVNICIRSCTLKEASVEAVEPSESPQNEADNQAASTLGRGCDKEGEESNNPSDEDVARNARNNGPRKNGLRVAKSVADISAKGPVSLRDGEQMPKSNRAVSEQAPVITPKNENLCQVTQAAQNKSDDKTLLNSGSDKNLNAEKSSPLQAVEPAVKPSLKKPEEEISFGKFKETDKDKTAEDKTAKDKIAENKTVEEEAVEERISKDKTTKDKATRNKTIKEKSTKDSPDKKALPEKTGDKAKEIKRAESPTNEDMESILCTQYAAGYKTPSGAFLQLQELVKLAAGTTKNGDGVKSYFLPTFIEDPWAGLPAIKTKCLRRF
ncbi:hypothetical protein ASPZODRAFT_758118 [Penicilliopsis zonata CBS 506.65]|uniref:Uncharacterized protein n=1 Tax=Penicilliopsis zonata CBS 506.65 TaxID=1073090 RepID=A0A1L9SAR1_9EURO|nr:hypothetical protein ASPZODRAFT_758118 [Penicilliopsis zonata CBS 506.65]OJJ44272.1 hypothetical protein ASPZODRAFT_758118 [Penicilliopsis zonata CBS 506.65]